MKLRSKSNLKNWELPEYELFELKPRKTRYCICIPVKNEGENIKKQLIKMKKYAKMADILILDWGSTDGSTNPRFLKNQHVKALLIKKGKGKQGTQLRMGFAYALKEGYEGIIQIDGNDKDGVEAIPLFIKSLDDDFGYVQGSRFIKGGKEANTPLVRLLGMKLIAIPLLSFAAHKLCTDITNGFRAYSRKYLLHKDVQPFRKIFMGYSLNLYLGIRASQLKFKTKEIPVLRKYPKGKTPSKMKGLKGPLDFLFEMVRTAVGYYHPKG